MTVTQRRLEDRELFAKLKKLITFGYINASGSISKFTHHNVLCDVPQIFENNINANIFLPGKVTQKENLVVLTTDLIGAVSCKSYLVMEEQEAEILATSVKEIMGVSTVPNEEVLKEVDNILAAGVTTCFSNQLRKKIYGGVPNVRRVKASSWFKEVEEDLSSLDFDLSDYDYFVVSKTRLLFPTLKIYPEFIWIIPDEFIKEV